MRSTPFILVIQLAVLACGDGSSVSAPPDTPTEEHPPDTPAEERPVWLWVGPEGEAPACSGGHPVAWAGWDLDTTAGECGACACGPAACVPPSTLLVHQGNCRGEPPDESVPVPIGSGDGWSGACVATTPPVPRDAYSAIVYKSSTLAPCTPSQPLGPPPISRRLVRACPSILDEDPPAGFVLCIIPEPDGSCRPGFPDRREFTDQVVDNRSCAPCACGAPTGGDCRVDIMVYDDASCDVPISGAGGLRLRNEGCATMSEEESFSAVRLTLGVQQPGACTPTSPMSEVIGTVERVETRVFCCAH